MVRSRQLRVYVCLAVLAALTFGCGGGGSGGDDVPIVDIDAQGRVALGALAGATVEVYRIGEYGLPVATTTTSTGATLGAIGNFSFLLENVPLDEVFLFVVTGGQAFDADENGVIDATPTPNLGTLHGIASAAQLDSGAILLSSLTEVVYQRVRYFLRARYVAPYVFHAAASWTSFLLRSSIAGGAAIDNDDALAFDPLLHAGALFRPYADFLVLVAALLAGTPLTETAFALSREQLTYVDLTSGTRGIEVVGNLAYVCHSAEGLDIYDVTNPLAPAFVGNYDTPGLAFAVQVVGSLAYVADFDGGLQIVNVSNPAAPTLAGAVATSGNVPDLAVVGNRAYLADSSTVTPMLHIVDVTTPGSASILMDFPTQDGAYAIRVQGSYAYVAQTSQIETIDIGNPLLPVSEGTVSSPNFGYMDLGSGHLFVSAGSVLEVFSLGTPTTPQSVAELILPGTNTNGIRVLGSQVIVSRSFNGLVSVDVQVPAAPSVIGVLSTDGSVNRADRVGNLYVMTEANGGLITAAAGTPPPSGVVASLSLGSSVDAVDAVGSRAYVTTGNPPELHVLSILDPLAPTVTGSVPLTMFGAEDIVVEGNLAYVAENGLQIFDVANPAAPFHVGGHTGVFVDSLALDTNVAYGGGNSSGLFVFDVTTPSTPSLLTTINTPGSSRGVAYDGSALVLCDGFPGIITFDATTPSAPAQVGVLDTSDAQHLAVQAPFAYVTDQHGNGIGDGVHVIDYATLNAPNSIRFVTLPGVGRVSLAGDFMYVSAHSEGVHVVDVSTPATATHVGSIPVPGRIEHLDVEGGFVYVGGGFDTGALMVLRAVQGPVP